MFDDIILFRKYKGSKTMEKFELPVIDVIETKAEELIITTSAE